MGFTSASFKKIPIRILNVSVYKSPRDVIIGILFYECFYIIFIQDHIVKRGTCVFEKPKSQMVTQKSDDHAKVRLAAQKCDCILSICTPNNDGVGLATLMTACHEYVMRNIFLAIQNQEDGSDMLFERSKYMLN